MVVVCERNLMQEFHHLRSNTYLISPFPIPLCFSNARFYCVFSYARFISVFIMPDSIVFLKCQIPLRFLDYIFWKCPILLRFFWKIICYLNAKSGCSEGNIRYLHKLKFHLRLYKYGEHTRNSPWIHPNFEITGMARNIVNMIWVG